MDKLSKLRQGQEVDLNFLNTFVETVNEIIDEFASVKKTNQDSSKLVGKLSDALDNFDEEYKKKLQAIPNLSEIVKRYAELQNTFSFEDKIREANSPLDTQHNLSFIVTDNMVPYLQRSKSVKEKTIFLQLDESERIGIFWFFYNNEFYNFSRTDTGEYIISSIPSIEIGENGNWYIGGVDSGKPSRGPQGTQGIQGIQGPQGVSGPRGETGLQGAQGRTGNPGRTPVVKFCSADDASGTGKVENEFRPGKKYIGLKFVYSDSSEDEILSTPWNYIKIVGDTYYPHLSVDGKLYFSTIPPTEEYTEGYNIKGDKGDKGDTGPAVKVRFVKHAGQEDEEIIEPESVTETQQDGTVVNYQKFSDADFKGEQGEQGIQGIQGPTGPEGPTGPVAQPYEGGTTIAYSDQIAVPKIELVRYTEGTFGFRITLPNPKEGGKIELVSQSKKVDDPTNYPYGYTEVILKETNNLGESENKTIKIPHGAPGVTPEIGINGNWFIGATDTGIPATGPAGADGRDGQDGSTGPQGEQGPQGEPGTGITDISYTKRTDDTEVVIHLDNGTEKTIYVPGGPQGPQGETGAQGERGRDGRDGQDGATGAQGPQGVGIKTIESEAVEGGIKLTITLNDANETKTQFIIPKGNTGATGATGAQGPQGPQGVAGNGIASIGTSYDANNNVIVTITPTSGNPTSFTISKGAKGDKGDKGDKGEQGTSVTIAGTVASVASLPTASTVVAGSGYIVEEDEDHQDDDDNNLLGTLYVSNGSSWSYCGQVKGPKGDKGDTGSAGSDGSDGVSITSVTKTGTSGLVDTYTIAFSNGTSSTFTVTNGAQGNTGSNGNDGVGIASITSSTDSSGNTVVTVTGTNNQTLGTFTVAKGNAGTDGTNGTNGTDGKSVLTGTSTPSGGNDGDVYINTSTWDVYKKVSGSWGSAIGNIKGATGATGKGVTSIAKTGTSGKVDTYTITYSDSTTSTFTVTNGNDGSNGSNGTNGADGKSVLTGTTNPSGGNDGDIYINTSTWDVYKKVSGSWGSAIGNIKGAQGIQGPTGLTGSSITSGASNPATTNYREHDWFFNTTDYKFYELTISNNTKSWTERAMVKGADGATGTRGNTFTVNSSAPSSTTGFIAGDLYLDTSNYKLHRFSGSAWTEVGVIKGTDAPTITDVRLVTVDNVDNVLQFTIGGNTYPVKNSSNQYVSIVGATGNGISSITGPTTSGNVDTYTINFTNGTTKTFTVTNGTNGSNGTNGNTILSGTSAPTGGTDGDMYVKTDTWDVYKKISGTWTSVGNIKGATGSSGSNGADGNKIYSLGNTGSTFFGQASGHNAGDLGITTDGYALYVESDGTWCLQSNATLLKGTNGNKIHTYTSSGAPTSSDVTNPLAGDLAYNTQTYELYKYASNTWSSIGNLKGAPGADGSASENFVVDTNGSIDENTTLRSLFLNNIHKFFVFYDSADFRYLMWVWIDDENTYNACAQKLDYTRRFYLLEFDISDTTSPATVGDLLSIYNEYSETYKHYLKINITEINKSFNTYGTLVGYTGEGMSVAFEIITKYSGAINSYSDLVEAIKDRIIITSSGNTSKTIYAKPTAHWNVDGRTADIAEIDYEYDSISDYVDVALQFNKQTSPYPLTYLRLLGAESRADYQQHVLFDSPKGFESGNTNKKIIWEVSDTVFKII